MTTTFEIELGRSALGLRWPDGTGVTTPISGCATTTRRPFTRHEGADRRPAEHPEAPVAASASAVGDGLEVDWQDGPVSRFPLDWLGGHGPGRPEPDAADLPHETWRAGDFDVPRHDAGAIARDEIALRDWITRHGGLRPDDRRRCGGGTRRWPRAGPRIGFLRKTNFGESFEVISKPDPNNLAYTALALPLHTDLPNQELPPGYQFLHCIANDANGRRVGLRRWRGDGRGLARARPGRVRDAGDDPRPVPLPRRGLRHPRASTR
jgi:gamma-butyrobetaine dioxygenase